MTVLYHAVDSQHVPLRRSARRRIPTREHAVRRTGVRAEERRHREADKEHEDAREKIIDKGRVDPMPLLPLG